MSGSRLPRWRRTRAASEVVGVVVLFGLVIVGAALIVYFGVSALDQVDQRSDIEAAEDTLGEAREEFRTLAVDDSLDRVSLSLPGDDNALNVVNDGRMSFSLNGDPVCSATRHTGTLSYETDDDEVAYQASGLWRDSDPGNATMVAPPNLDYRTKVVDGVPVRTLDVPITNINASQSNVSAATQLTAQRAGTGPNDGLSRDLCLTGPNADRIDWVDNATIRVENNSYYRAWGGFLRSEFTVDGTLVANVTVYDTNQTVVVSDIPLGAVGDDDNDGLPDPDIDPSDPSLPDNLSDYHDNYAADPAIDNCPPEKDPSNSTRNPTQADSDGDNWGDACDDFGGGGGGTNAPPTVQFTAATDTGNTSTVVGDYSVNATDPDGRVVSVSTALVAVDGGSGTVVADSDHPVSPNASQVTVSGSLANASTADSYWLVAVARDRNGSTANVTTLVRDNGPSDSDDDGVPDPIDDCPMLNRTGENGCAAASTVGPGGDDALAVNASSATVTLLGSEVAERIDQSVTVRSPVDVSFALDGTGSLQWYDPNKKRVDATQTFLNKLNSTIDRAGWVEFRNEDAVPGCPPWNDRDDLSDYEDCAEVRESLGDNFDNGNFISDSEVNAYGGTYIGSGIDYATGQVAATNNSGKDIIVLFTDGLNDGNIADSVLNQETLAQASDAASEGVKIYTVGLGSNVNDTLLTQVANMTGGTYYPIGDDDDLEDTFDDIAGNVTEGTDVKRIELKRVEGGVKVGRSGSDTLLGTDLNNPSTTPTTTVSLGNGTNTSSVSLENFAYECTGGTTLVGNETHNGTEYERVTCPSNSTTIDTVDNSTADHEIYRDGDSVPTHLGDDWYRDDIESVIPNTYMHTGNNTFDLAPNQAVFVLTNGDNYTATLFEATPTPPSGGSPTPPGVGPTPPGGGAGSPVDGIENRFVVDVDGTEVVFEGGD